MKLIKKSKLVYHLLNSEENCAIGSTNNFDVENYSMFKYKLSFDNCQKIEQEQYLRNYFKWHSEKGYVSHKELDIKEYVDNASDINEFDVQMAVEKRCSCRCHFDSGVIHFVPCCNPGNPISDFYGCVILSLI
jgi:hypothetical protein